MHTIIDIHNKTLAHNTLFMIVKVTLSMGSLILAEHVSRMKHEVDITVNTDNRIITQTGWCFSSFSEVENLQSVVP